MTSAKPSEACPVIPHVTTPRSREQATPLRTWVGLHPLGSHGFRCHVGAGRLLGRLLGSDSVRFELDVGGSPHARNFFQGVSALLGNTLALEPAPAKPTESLAFASHVSTHRITSIPISNGVIENQLTSWIRDTLSPCADPTRLPRPN